MIGLKAPNKSYQILLTAIFCPIAAIDEIKKKDYSFNLGLYKSFTNKFLKK